MDPIGFTWNSFSGNEMETTEAQEEAGYRLNKIVAR